ncbi:MAG: GGDEF domain-containing protein [Planctomycetes bacterium]|nr:GGDEF domain-containing protein [Planctomycetota bacterium]
MRFLPQKNDSKLKTRGSKLVHVSGWSALVCLLMCMMLFLVAVADHVAARLTVKLLAWSMFLWSGVATAYAFLTYLGVRAQRPRGKADLGYIDPLTGLPNRKGIVAELERLDTSMREYGRRVRLVDIDVVDLSRVNYEFGLLIGDAVLQDIAGILSSNVPEGYIVGRLGGDEFLVVAPASTRTEAEELASELEGRIADYNLTLGDRGEVCSLKAQVSVADYVPEKISLHETVVSAKEAATHGELPDASSEDIPSYYHIPRVTLGAFAAGRWKNLPEAVQQEFKRWQREMDPAFTERMCDDIMRLFDEKTESNWVDFVTAVPAGDAAGGNRYPARVLAETVAKRMEAPYRHVMRGGNTGPEQRAVQPTVDAMINDGECALLVSDLVSSGILERRCVKKLSSAGAHVEVVAWTAY